MLDLKSFNSHTFKTHKISSLIFHRQKFQGEEGCSPNPSLLYTVGEGLPQALVNRLTQRYMNTLQLPPHIIRVPVKSDSFRGALCRTAKPAFIRKKQRKPNKNDNFEKSFDLEDWMYKMRRTTLVKNPTNRKQHFWLKNFHFSINY